MRTKTVDVRVIAATNADLDAATERGEFRADLLYRLKVLTLTLAPLRERPEDILPLARHALARMGDAYRRQHAVSVFTLETHVCYLREVAVGETVEVEARVLDLDRELEAYDNLVREG